MTPNLSPREEAEAKPAYRCIGGSIVYRGVWLEDAEAQRQADLAEREAIACKRLGDDEGHRVARAWFFQITDALAAQADWKRCASAPRHHSTKAA